MTKYGKGYPFFVIQSTLVYKQNLLDIHSSMRISMLGETSMFNQNKFKKITYKFSFVVLYIFLSYASYHSIEKKSGFNLMYCLSV